MTEKKKPELRLNNTERSLVEFCGYTKEDILKRRMDRSVAILELRLSDDRRRRGITGVLS